jgi:hypothetical protein
MNEEKDYLYSKEIEKSVTKHIFSWHGWASPTGLGLFLVEVGIFLWMLHLANIIH